MGPQGKGKLMTYSDSAKGTRITKARALKELKAHGIVGEDINTFLAEMGDKENYLASNVLAWLGY